jgi:hypothetical protein
MDAHENFCVCGHEHKDHFNAGERNICGGGKSVNGELGCRCDGFITSLNFETGENIMPFDYETLNLDSIHSQPLSNESLDAWQKSHRLSEEIYKRWKQNDNKKIQIEGRKYQLIEIPSANIEIFDCGQDGEMSENDRRIIEELARELEDE